MARHQVHIERLKTQLANKFDPFLIEMSQDIRKQLSGDDLTELGIRRLNQQLKAIGEMIDGLYASWYQEWLNGIEEFAEYEAGFTERAVSQYVTAEFNSPSSTQVIGAVLSRPLDVEGVDGGKLLKPFFDGYEQKTKDRVKGAIRQGYAQGQTNREIQQRIIGTRANGYKDGIMAISNREANLITRTAVQHAASYSSEKFYEVNSDKIIGVRWISTLDSRTTAQCKSLDRKVFKIDKGPRPPIHIGCRSTTAPEVSSKLDYLKKGATRPTRGADGVELVPQSTTYYSWLKTQDLEFIETVIGPTRAKLLLDGGLSAERFADLQLNKRFEPLTLEQMRLLEPTAFKRAGID